MKLIKQSPFHKVWQANKGESFGNSNGEYVKYLVVDLRDGGKTALRTNSILQAMAWEPEFTDEEKMASALLSHINEFSHKNTDFNRVYNMETEIDKWNQQASLYNRPEFIIAEKFTRRQDLANRFAEIYEAL